MIGIYSKNIKMCSLLTQIVQPLIVFLAPVMIPYEILPLPLKYTSYIIPTKYVAEAFRQALNNKVDYFGIGILCIISLLSIYLVCYKMDWSRE